MGAEARVHELKLTLPPAPGRSRLTSRPCDMATCCMSRATGRTRPTGRSSPARSAGGLDVEAGRLAARQVGLAILSTLRANLGTLDRVVRLVKALGLVNCTPDFHDQPKVINGFSDLMVEVFGDAGKGAHSAVGAPALPGNIAVEIEAIFEVEG